MTLCRRFVALLGLAAAAAAQDPQAPEVFQVEIETTIGDTKGRIILEVTRAWAPLGVDRFYALIQDGFYDDAAFFRVVPGFVLQFGIASTPEANEKWATPIPDDPVTQSNLQGTITRPPGRTPGPRSSSSTTSTTLSSTPRASRHSAR